MQENKYKNKTWITKILALAIIVFFNGVIFGGVVMAQDTVEQCKQKAETQYTTDTQECETKYTNAKGDCCDDFEPGTPERNNCESATNQPFDIESCLNKASVENQNCLLTADINKSDAIQKCGSEVPSVSETSTCGNGKVDKGEECDDGEGQGDDTDKYIDPNQPDRLKQLDSCFKCKYVDVPYEFNVTKYLKIPEGQTYLEKSDNTDTGVSLKKGVVYFLIKAIEFATKIISAFALLMIIVGGIVLMISSGNSSLQQKGKRLVLYSVLGLVIAFLSLIIVTAVQSIFYTT